MIKSITIHNFKCFETETIDFGALTVLCGQNGVGKSSVIQSLLLSREASVGHPYVELNGPFNLELGTLDDVFHRGTDARQMKFTINTKEGETFCYSFKSDDSSGENPFLILQDPAKPSLDFTKVDSPFAFTYLCAERNGPRDIQGIQSRPKDQMGIGVKGEFAAEVFKKFENTTVNGLRLHSNGKDNESLSKLGKQAEFWMGNLIPDIEIRSEPYQNTNATSIRVRQGGVSGEWMRPCNFGFGFSYSLPIVLAGLLVPVGGILIIENPEAHLHPAAQSKLAKFLVSVAGSGVQVVVETHSEHVVNGIRLGWLRAKLNASDAVFHFFSYSPGKQPVLNQIGLTPNSDLTNWPKGFLDQEERDLAELFALQNQ